MMRLKDMVKLAGIVSLAYVCLTIVLPPGVSGYKSRYGQARVNSDCPNNPPNTTNLLFKFVTNQAGFDTGLAIANTGLDPIYKTVGTTGTCTLYFYGDGPSAGTSLVTPPIAPGSVYTTTVSNVAAGLQGYIIATCNFSYAEGSQDNLRSRS